MRVTFINYTKDAERMLIFAKSTRLKMQPGLMEKIRNMRKETGKPPVIMITANPGARHKIYAETMGVDVYINKPFRMDKLVTAARDLLARE